MPGILEIFTCIEKNIHGRGSKNFPKCRIFKNIREALSHNMIMRCEVRFVTPCAVPAESAWKEIGGSNYVIRRYVDACVYYQRYIVNLSR